MPVGQRPAVPAGLLRTREHEAQLDLHVGTRPAIVDHRAIGCDPHVAGHAPGAAAVGMCTEDRLGARRRLRLDQGTLGGDPVVELAVAHAQTAQFVERPGRLRIGQLRDEEEGPLPDTGGVLHPGLQTECQVEGHDLRAAGAAAIAATGEPHLPRERHHPPAGAPVALQDPAAVDVAPLNDERSLERPDDLRPQLPAHLGQSGADGPLQRTDVGTLGMQLYGQRDRDGDRLHGEPLRVLVPTPPAYGRGSPRT